MSTRRSLPSPLTILFFVIILASFATWLVPAGEYNKLAVEEGRFIMTTENGKVELPLSQQTLDSLHIKIALQKFTGGAIRKPVSIPGTYHRMKENRQGLLSILQAPVKGIYDTVDILLFILVTGGFMQVFYESGALVKGVVHLSYRMKGKESWLIIILTFLFSFAGSSYGMAEEALAFYPVIVPLFLAAGYDLLVPLAVIYGGTQLGTLSSFSNPFSTIIASNAAGVNWRDGLNERLLMFLLSTAISIWYIVRYAQKVKKDPSASIVYNVEGEVKPPYETITYSDGPTPALGTKNISLIFLFLFTFLTMIGGVIFFDWWLREMTTLFLAASILTGLLLRMKEKKFVQEFIKGAENLLNVAFIVGVARGVSIVLNEGRISDSILYYSTRLVSGVPAVLFIILLFGLFMVFTLFISSSSGMAVLTMPIIGALAIMVNIPGKETVNAYLYGMGIMGFLTPTGLILPSLALVNVSIKSWWQFIRPLMLMLLILCCVFLVAGVLFS